MIAAQTTIFSDLERYVESRGEAVPDAGSARWIAGDREDSLLLAGAAVVAIFRISPRKTLTRIDFDGLSYFCCVGFEVADGPAGLDPSGLTEADLTPGVLAVALAEARPAPVATPLEISNVVGPLKKGDPDYVGHDYDVIANLYGPITVYSGADLDESETWRAFFEICTRTAISSDTWLDESLARELVKLSELSVLGLPFQTLCRSVFDTDQASMFLALYRCLEGLYAYTAATKLASSFELGLPWKEVAVRVEQVLGWRPREEESLLSLLKYAQEDDLKAVLGQAAEARLEGENSNLPERATKIIYKLRNNLVHYRPIHHSFEFEKIKWNELSATVARMIKSIYASIHAEPKPELAEKSEVGADSA